MKFLIKRIKTKLLTTYKAIIAFFSPSPKPKPKPKRDKRGRFVKK
tara:strand:+ start:718 stop:852 length:135 start_codon:yes stop_codon:yes gene_type:complete